MTRVYGYSDDNLVIEGAPYPDDEVFCFHKEAIVKFYGGTVIRCGYGKNGKGIWYIEVVQAGNKPYTLDLCDDENAKMYSDVFTTEAAFLCVETKTRW